MSVNKKDIVKAARELNNVLGLEPKIDPTQPVEKLKEEVTEAAGLLEPEDEFSPKVQETIDQLLTENGVDFEDEEEEDEEEDEEEEEEEEPETEDAAPEEELAPVPAKKTPIKPVGIISTIVEVIQAAGQKGVSKEEILSELEKKFPDRNAKSMKNTINVQVPSRINKEKFPVENVDGKYRAKK